MEISGDHPLYFGFIEKSDALVAGFGLKAGARNDRP